MKRIMSSPTEPTVEPSGRSVVRLSIDEATVLLGLLDLLQPAPSSDAAIVALVDRSRDRLASAIAQSMHRDGRGLHSV